MASLALRGLDKSSNVMHQAMERLSSGKRINRSADDAAGMGISLVHKAQTMGLGGAVKHAVDAIGVVNSIEGSLATANDLLLRMRELAVQASSDVNVKAERKSIQDEVNQINSALNALASETKFNNKKLLDGTYNAKITIGKDAQEFVNLSVNPMDASSVGSYEINSKVEIINPPSNDHENAKNTLNSQFSADADYEVKGANGSATINMNGGEDARDVARAFNLATGATGVTASAVTRLKIVNVTESDHFSFTLQGREKNASVVTASIADKDDLTTLKNSINSVSSDTGIVADLVNNKSSILLVQSEGYDIIIGDLTTVSGNMTVDAVEKNISGKLIDQNNQRVLNGNGSGSDSVSIFGQVTLSSSKAFSITSGHGDNHFNTSTEAITSDFVSLDNIDLSTQETASMAMARLDSAIAMISEMRSEMGAKSVRFQSIINNLTNVEINTERHMDFLEDAEFTTESSKLARSQVVQEASTAMIAQANNVSKFMMSFLNQFK
jgi:flagellin